MSVQPIPTDGGTSLPVGPAQATPQGDGSPGYAVGSAVGSAVGGGLAAAIGSGMAAAAERLVQANAGVQMEHPVFPDAPSLQQARKIHAETDGLSYGSSPNSSSATTIEAAASKTSETLEKSSEALEQFNPLQLQLDRSNPLLEP